jgi:hypothetical protein
VTLSLGESSCSVSEAGSQRGGGGVPADSDIV